MKMPFFENGYCITPEGFHFEAKEASKGIMPRDGWETYSAFANTDGGIIALGLRETEGRLMVVGVPDPSGCRQNLINQLNNREKVSVNILSEEDIETIDVGGKDVLIIKVPRADRCDRPVYIDGNTRNSYRRRGEADCKCSPEEVASMVSDSLRVATDRVMIDGMEAKDLDRETVSAYRNSLGSHRPNHPWTLLDDDEFLRVLGAAVKDGDTYRPTMAGLLMFGVAYSISMVLPNYRLDYREYGGLEDGWDYRLSSWSGDWSGNLFDFYNRVMNRMMVASGREFRIDSDMRRVENAPLDRCLREMTVNALVNADYRMPGAVTVEWRREQVSVGNPGSFRIPLERAMKGGYSDPRNITIAGMFSLIGSVEQAGSGIHRMVASCREIGLEPPRFEEEFDPSRVTVTLTMSKVGADIRTYIVEAMERDPKVTISEIAESLNVKRSLVEKTVNQLKDEGVVERTGGRRGSWCVRGYGRKL